MSCAFPLLQNPLWESDCLTNRKPRQAVETRRWAGCNHMEAREPGKVVRKTPGQGSWAAVDQITDKDTRIWQASEVNPVLVRKLLIRIVLGREIVLRPERLRSCWQAHTSRTPFILSVSLGKAIERDWVYSPDNCIQLWHYCHHEFNKTHTQNLTIPCSSQSICMKIVKRGGEEVSYTVGTRPLLKRNCLGTCFWGISSYTKTYRIHAARNSFQLRRSLGSWERQKRKHKVKCVWRRQVSSFILKNEGQIRPRGTLPHKLCL